MNARARLACADAARRRRLFGNPDWNGIDFLEVSDDQLSLCVHFFGSIPEAITVANVRIEGGRRVRGIVALAVRIDRAEDPERDDCLRIGLDKFGDFSTYRLCLVAAAQADDLGRADPAAPLSGLDPRYACLDFSFKVACPSQIDCRDDRPCIAPPAPAPRLNYLAKDYASLRQLIYDRLALTMPDWQERHVPDLGVTLVELLAYVGDHLSYYQDAVATEAYLETARRRISVRRHARLVDYRLHEGCNARAWVAVRTSADLDPIKAGALYFITGFDDIESGSGNVVRHADLESVPAARYEVFEPLLADPEGELRFRAAHSEMRFYTWGDGECCLAAGATGATLLDQLPDAAQPARLLHLQAGDTLILVEAIGPTTGNPADADPAHRQAVRLTRVAQAVDGLLGKLVLEIEWAAGDALRFALCLSTRLAAPECRRVADVSVARGNVVLVDHGRRAGATLGPVGERGAYTECACPDTVLEGRSVAARFTPVLADAGLTFAAPLAPGLAAAALTRQDVREAMPQLVLEETPREGAARPLWRARHDLLASDAEARHFVTEIDDEGYANLRFGDGDLGRLPEAGSTFYAGYRIGNGAAGNVGAGSIAYLVLREGALSAEAIVPDNPLPAGGGSAPEAVAEAKLLAPHAVRAQLARAITADDYAHLAQRDSRVQRAAAALRWMGSWHEAGVALDPFDTAPAGPALCEDLAAQLFGYRRMGHDLAVGAARYVPLALTMQLCVRPHYARAAVRAAALALLGSARVAGGGLGLFHPDRLSFGQGVHVSRLIAAVMAVEGVQSAGVLKLARLDRPTGAGAALEAVPADGVLPMGAMEIAQLDNDPDFPENGKLELIVRGGI
ncbi:MAG: putative baseplate assembly protein [Pseudomonadota bacterium]